jgi:DNA invertase Pin-like site-specific DNA recombinase
MSTRKIKYISYQRYSNPAQADGASMQGQAAIAKRVAEENGLEYEAISDHGVSAYKGKNAEEGEPGEFISNVRTGNIPNNCWLVVENLDRLTRQSPYKAFGLLSELIELGVTIVTGMDNKKYCKVQSAFVGC